MGFDKYRMWRIPHYSVTQELHGPKIALCFSNHGLVTVSVGLPLPECHMVGIIQYVAFPYWLFSLSNMHLNVLYVFLWYDR